MFDMKKKCIICGKLFDTRDSHKLTCGDICSRIRKTEYRRKHYNSKPKKVNDFGKLIEQYYRTQIEYYGYVKYGIRKWPQYNEPTIYKIDVCSKSCLVLRIKEKEYSKEDIKKIITNDIDKFEKAVIADVNNDECLNLTAEDKEYVYKKFKEIINDRQNSKY